MKCQNPSDNKIFLMKQRIGRDFDTNGVDMWAAEIIKKPYRFNAIDAVPLRNMAYTLFVEN